MSSVPSMQILHQALRGAKASPNALLNKHLNLGLTMIWTPAVKHCIWKGEGEDRVVVNSKNLLICDKSHERANLTHCGKHN